MGYFDENRKFIALNGVLGRRDFIINCLRVDLIEGLFFLTPFVYLLFLVPEMRAIALGEIRPMWFLIMHCVVACTSTALYFPSVVRRVRDIIGEEDDNRVFMIASIISVIIFMGYTPVAASFFGGWILFFVLFSLMFMKGKITGEKPASDVIKFNWGAFFGTWIWGVFNKVPKTLIILPLFLTVAWLPFMLICGLKGNEWVYEKTKETIDSIESFHLKQRVQSIVLALLSPVFTFAIATFFFFVSAYAFGIYSEINPGIKDVVISKAQQLQVRSAEDGFEKIEFVDGVYRFYLTPQDWAVMQNKDVLKRSLMRSAIGYVLIKNGKTSYLLEDLLDSIDLVNKVKIYSTFNGEVLAEIYIEPAIAKKYRDKIEDDKMMAELKDIIYSSYNFNSNPSLP